MTLAPPAVPGLEALNSAAQAAGQQAEDNLTAYQQAHPELYGGEDTSAVPQGGAVGPTGAVAGYAAPAQPYQPPAPSSGLLGQIGGGIGALGNLITRPSSGFGVGVPAGQGTAPAPELSAFNYAGQATEIPGAREAVNRYVAPAVNLLAPWASLPQQAIGQAGGPQLPSTGEIAASQVPTNLRDIALAAAPFAGEIGRGAQALAENPALRELGGRVLADETGSIFGRPRMELDANGNLVPVRPNVAPSEYIKPPEIGPQPAPGAAGSVGREIPVPSGVMDTWINRTVPWVKSGDAFVNGEPVTLYQGTTAANAAEIARTGEINKGFLTTNKALAEARIGHPGPQGATDWRVIQVQAPIGSVHPEFGGPNAADGFEIAKPIPVSTAGGEAGGIGQLRQNIRQSMTPEGVAAMKAGEEDVARQQAVRAAQTMGGMRGGLTTSLDRQLQNSIDALKKIAGDESGAVTLPEKADANSILREVIGAAGAPTALKSMLSPPLLRQGLARLVTNPVAAWRETTQSLRAAVSEQATEAVQQAIREAPHVRASGEAPMGQLGLALGGEEAFPAGTTWKDVGGTLLETGAKGTIETSPEELQVLKQSWLGRKIQEFAPVKLSDRQMAVELNLHRTNWYRDVASHMLKTGERDQGEYIRLRKFIEHATQRGSWSQGSLPTFFSTRALSGRVQFVMDLLKEIPRGIVTGRIRQPGVGQEAAKTLVGMAAAGSAMVGIPAALGIGSIQMSGGLPVLKIGGQHFDPWAGWNTLAKLVYGVGKDVADVEQQGGNAADKAQAFGQRGWQRSVGFARSALGPFAGELANIGTGKDFLGQPYDLGKDLRSGNLAANMVAPFIVSDLYDAYKTAGIGGAALRAAPSFFSMGGGDYFTNAEKRQQGAEAIGLPNYDAGTPEQKKQINQSQGIVSPIFEASTPNTAEGVDNAIRQAQGEGFGHVVKPYSMSREIDPRDTQTRQAWNDSKPLLSQYFEHLVDLVPDATLAASGYKPPVRKANETTEAYNARWEDSWRNAARELAQKQNPTLDAWIAWWGGGDTLQSSAAWAPLADIQSKYGVEIDQVDPATGRKMHKPPFPGWDPHLATGAK